jgi:hypothetical protein
MAPNKKTTRSRLMLKDALPDLFAFMTSRLEVMNRRDLSQELANVFIRAQSLIGCTNDFYIVLEEVPKLTADEVRLRGYRNYESIEFQWGSGSVELLVGNFGLLEAVSFRNLPEMATLLMSFKDHIPGIWRHIPLP